MVDSASGTSVDDPLGRRSTKSPEHSPITRWVAFVATAVGALALVLRSDTAMERGAVVAVAVLAAGALWRVDTLHARGRLDRPLIVFCAALLGLLIAMNLVLSQQLDDARAERDGAESSLAATEEASSRETGVDQDGQDEAGDDPGSTSPDLEDRGTTSAPSTTSSVPEETTTTGSPTLYNSGSYELWGGGDPYFDLDGWEAWISLVSEVDIIVDDGTLSTANAAQLAESTDDQYRTCLEATGWKTYVELGDIGVGSFFCVRTAQGRLAAIKVTGVNEYLTDQLIFVGSVWETS